MCIVRTYLKFVHWLGKGKIFTLVFGCYVDSFRQFVPKQTVPKNIFTYKTVQTLKDKRNVSVLPLLIITYNDLAGTFL